MRPRARSFLAATLGYLLFLFALCPAFLEHPTDQIWGDHGDALQNVWNGWWMHHSLARGEWPMDNTTLSYPDGVSLWLHTFGPFNALVTALGRTVLPQEAAFNVTVLLQLMLAALGGFVLSREVIASAARAGRLRGAISPLTAFLCAFLGGVIFAFNSYQWVHLPGHLHCLSIGPMAFFAHALIRAIDQPLGFRWPIVAAGWALVTLLCGFYVFVDLMMIASGIGLVAIFARGRSSTRPIRATLLTATLSGAVVLPIIYATVHANSGELDGTHDPLRFSADLESLYTPGPFMALGTEYADQVHRWTGWWENGSYLGIVGSLAAILGFVLVRGRWPLALLGSGAVATSLSLGPVLHDGGVVDHATRLPYGYLAEVLPIVDGLGCPVRFSIVLTLAIGVGAAVGTAKVVSMISRLRALRLAAPWLVGFVVLLATAEIYPSRIVTTELPERAFLSELKTRDDGMAVADLTGWYWPLYHQTLHEHPMVFSYTSRRPFDYIHRVERDPVLGPIMGAALYGRRSIRLPYGIPAEVARDHLREEWNVGWVIAAVGAHEGYLRDELGLTERARGDGVTLWEVRAGP